MKKLVLIMVSALLLVVFIGFNYLLWERDSRENDLERLKNLNVNNSTTMSSYELRITRLENDKEQLENQTEQMLEEINKLTSNIELEKEEKSKYQKLLEQKYEIILKLKDMVGQEYFEKPVRDWVNYLNRQDYQAAFKIQFLGLDETDEKEKFSLFESIYKDTVKQIDIHSMEIHTPNIPDNNSGDIVFKVIMDVEITRESNRDDLLFQNGYNEVYFTINYNKEYDKWFIEKITH